VDSLVVVQPQGVGERAEHLGGGVAVAALLEPGEVLDADPGERGELGPAQAGGAAARPTREPDVGGGDSLPADTQEVAEFGVAHGPNLPVPAARIVALPVPASARPSSLPSRRAR
jgi:hypothetical protein